MFSVIVSAQTLRSEDDKNTKEKKGFSWDKVEVGGGLSLSFGTITFIDISPSLGYRFADNYVAGIGLTYIYYRQKYLWDINSQGDRIYKILKTSMYGGRVFNQYFITENIFAHAEYEALNIEYVDALGNHIKREWVGSPLVGGGFAQSKGRASRWYILVLYNLNEHQGSPYTNPLFKMGFAVGL